MAEFMTHIECEGRSWSQSWMRMKVVSIGGLGWLGHQRPRVIDRPLPGKFSSWRPKLIGANRQKGVAKKFIFKL